MIGIWYMGVLGGLVSVMSWILCRNDSTCSISPVIRSLGNFHQYISPCITCLLWARCKLIIPTSV